MKKIKNLKISLDFIPSDVMFFMGEENHNKYVDLCKMGEDWYLTNDGLTTDLWSDEVGHSVMISITSKPYDVYQVKGLIVHEISHAVDYIMTRHNIKDEEIRAYLSQHLYIQIMKYYDKQMGI